MHLVDSTNGRGGSYPDMEAFSVKPIGKKNIVILTALNPDHYKIVAFVVADMTVSYTPLNINELLTKYPDMTHYALHEAVDDKNYSEFIGTVLNRSTL